MNMTHTDNRILESLTLLSNILHKENPNDFYYLRSGIFLQNAQAWKFELRKKRYDSAIIEDEMSDIYIIHIKDTDNITAKHNFTNLEIQDLHKSIDIPKDTLRKNDNILSAQLVLAVAASSRRISTWNFTYKCANEDIPVILFDFRVDKDKNELVSSELTYPIPINPSKEE